MTAVPARGVQRSATAGPTATPTSGETREKAAAKTADRSAQASPESAVDLDDLARRLLDPVSRLLRADLRRGRERAGRPTTDAADDRNGTTRNGTTGNGWPTDDGRHLRDERVLPARDRRQRPG
ncbi:hypothetical protein NKH77_40655 [Streptomyces sp. M19]